MAVFEYSASRASYQELPTGLRELAASGDIHRLQYPDGNVGWIVTGYEVAKELLRSDALSANSLHKQPPVSRSGAQPFLGEVARPGWLVDMDPPDHTIIRKVLTPFFSRRRIDKLEISARGWVSDALDAISGDDGAVDLIDTFALRVPSDGICELLGVPVSAQSAFQHATETLFQLDASPTAAVRAMEELEEIARATLDEQSAKEGSLSFALNSELDSDSAVGCMVLLMTAGHETTANSLGLALLYILRDREVWNHVVATPGDISVVVEELLRISTIFQFGVPRSVLRPTTIQGVELEPGELVTISLSTANRDQRVFGHPDDIVLSRREASHLAFGHGIHHCVGQNLARLELTVALEGFVSRFPLAALATDALSIPLRTDMGIFGLHELPVYLKGERRTPSSDSRSRSH
ncbi:cytochrome P450 [Curtobacterium flaccumfaciens]|uniref:cytochrome P450 n=1 Tax=Curtobacterium flaccumfaciens TaxID=2035 RepID=UPI001BDE3AE3|nr:cytochrome P450 [Curtobacterium flaccumfaciens]MBT1672841.1 cytochrome P450 [Curtobacterium flaccumfaciens pv. flaccumfaciens]